MRADVKKNKIKAILALAGWLSWLEHRPIDEKGVGSIPAQGTYPGCGGDPQSGHVQEATNRCFSLFLSLSPNSLKSVNTSLGEED